MGIIKACPTHEITRACLSGIPMISLLCLSDHNAHPRCARCRVQVLCASRQNKAGASQKVSERASERRCMLHEWVPVRRTAPRILPPPATRCSRGCADWRGAVTEPAADEPIQRTLPISTTWPFHPSGTRTTGSATVSAGRGARYTATLWPSWYSFHT